MDEERVDSTPPADEPRGDEPPEPAGVPAAAEPAGEPPAPAPEAPAAGASVGAAPAEPAPPAAPPPPPPPPVPSRAVVLKHHALVRLAHWGNVPLLFGLIASGLSIYWAAPVFHHGPDLHQGDYLAALGAWIAGLLHDTGGNPRAWIYDHFGIGGGLLAPALRWHWALAYLFMLNGVLYAVGLAKGGGWRALLPRPSDVPGAVAMLRFYLGLPVALVLRRPWPHPPQYSKYNPLQRAAYFAMPICGLLAIASGWAMHKPVQLGWLERAFVSYDGARAVHFTCMLVLGSFVVPHVVLATADGWDTLRSMVVGWSARVRRDEHV